MSDITPEDALADAKAEVERALDTATQLSSGTALEKGRDNATETKKRLGSAFSQISIQRKAALSKVEAAKEVIEVKRRELETQQRELAAMLAPLQKQLDRLEDGISAVNLYLGRDEELEELRDGSSAPTGTPLTIRQTVLAMDEETALDPEAGGLDFQKIDVFLEWLLASDEHLAQVIPDAKGVVTFMARRTPIDYTGNPIADAERNKANFHTHWLLRNGERLYLMTTDFSVGTLLIPPRRSFTRLFDGLEPGTSKWIAAEEAADAMTRHYMKVALILQGLVDRTAVFHPLPEDGLNLLGDFDYDTGKVVLIEDDEKAITTARQPFKEWQKERIARLDVGQRVIGYFPSWSGSRDESGYTTPRYASAPMPGVAHTITRQDGHNWYFSYERTDDVEKFNRWGHSIGYGPAEQKASYRLEKGQWEPSFIPVDTVTIEEMEEYLAARTERKAYAQMFPALKAAIEFKRAEHEAEAPFRALIAAELGDAALAEELVAWYKLSAKWYRPLVGDPVAEGKALRAIRAEADRRSKPLRDGTIARIYHAAPDALVIARRTNDFVAVIPAKRKYGAELVPQNLWVHLRFFTLAGAPRMGADSSREWVTLTKAQIAKWTILGEAKEWKDWTLNVAPGDHLPDPAIDSLISELYEWVPEEEVAVIKYHEPTSEYETTKAFLYFASYLNEDGDLVQPYAEKRITIKQGMASFNREKNRRWGWSTHEWKMEHPPREQDDMHRGFPDQTKPRVPVSPHTVNWSGAFPKAVAYQSKTILKADMQKAALWADEQNRDEKRRRSIQVYADQVYRGWATYEEETRRARFIEDFGDPELWEDHKKSQKPTPFPLRNNMGAEPLQKLAAAIVDDGQMEVAGKTVGEVLAFLDKVNSTKIPGIPVELLPVRFPEARD